jgi:hypothetical protein
VTSVGLYVLPRDSNCRSWPVQLNSCHLRWSSARNTAQRWTSGRWVSSCMSCCMEIYRLRVVRNMNCMRPSVHPIIGCLPQFRRRLVGSYTLSCRWTIFNDLPCIKYSVVLSSRHRSRSSLVSLRGSRCLRNIVFMYIPAEITSHSTSRLRACPSTVIIESRAYHSKTVSITIGMWLNPVTILHRPNPLVPIRT